MRVSFRSIIGLLGACALAACASGETDDWDDGRGISPTEPTESEDEAAPEGPKLVKGLKVTGIAVFQAVKVPIVEDGEWVAKRNAPLIAGRPALVRVYVEPGSGYSARKVSGELRLVSGGKPLDPVVDAKAISGVSKDSDPKSTFNFAVPAEAITAGTTFHVALTAPDGEIVTGESDAQFPRDGAPRALAAKTSVPLKISLVPIKYAADGSNRLPDMSDAQLLKLKNTMLARYPATTVELSIHDTFAWNKPVAANGGGWDALLSEMIGLRARENAPKDVYYFGLFNPADTRAAYCSYGSCVAGLSPLAGDGNSAMRAAIGIGYEGQEAANTMAHELGHAHGRAHAPCGNPKDIDERFPYDDGTIGVWGYDIVARKLISPTKGRDMMGYCDNEWVSDYTFAALFKRMTSILTEESRITADPFAASRSYRLATASADGSLAWGTTVTVDREPTGGEEREATYATATGALVATRAVRFYPFDHVAGGIVMLPEEVTPTTVSGVAARAAAPWARVSVRGFATTLAR